MQTNLLSFPGNSLVSSTRIDLAKSMKPFIGRRSFSLPAIALRFFLLTLLRVTSLVVTSEQGDASAGSVLMLLLVVIVVVVGKISFSR